MARFFIVYISTPIVWLLIGISAFLFFLLDAVVWLLSFWWDKRLWLLHRYSIVWAMFYIWINPFWKIDIAGEKNIRKGQPYIIISNHQSAMDIVLLYRLRMHFKWVAKREIFKIPVIGWNLWLNRHIAIDRTSVKGALKMIKQAQEHLKQGNSVLIFPEGTRSTDGKIKRFKDGAFVLAKKANYPILPVVIEGTMEVLPKEGYTIKGKQTLKMRILPEVAPENFQNMDVVELTQTLHNQLSEAHAQLAPQHYANNE
jgi:1-acyl-sn-glycerol-3-phosphate acyltransferase